MLNFTIYEDGNGGQLVLRNNEIAHTRGLATLAYTQMFGGNVDQSTAKENPDGELRFDWWGNDPNLNSDTWTNSETERTLRGLALTSATRLQLLTAVKKDVKPLEKYGSIECEVILEGINRARINVKITEPTKKSANTLSIIWDATRNEVIENNIL